MFGMYYQKFFLTGSYRQVSKRENRKILIPRGRRDITAFNDRGKSHSKMEEISEIKVFQDNCQS